MQRLASVEYARLASAFDDRGMYEEADHVMGICAMQVAIEAGARPSDPLRAAELRQDMDMFRVAVKHGYTPSNSQEATYKTSLLDRLETTIRAYDEYYSHHGHDLVRLARSAGGVRVAQLNDVAESPETPTAERASDQLIDNLMLFFESTSEAKSRLAELVQDWSPSAEAETMDFVNKVIEEEMSGVDTHEVKSDNQLGTLFRRYKVNGSRALMEKFLKELPVSTSPPSTEKETSPPPAEGASAPTGTPEPPLYDFNTPPPSPPSSTPEVGKVDETEDVDEQEGEEGSPHPASAADDKSRVAKLFSKYTPKQDWLATVESAADHAKASEYVQQALNALRAGQEGYRRKQLSKGMITRNVNVAKEALSTLVEQKFGTPPDLKKKSPAQIAENAVDKAVEKPVGAPAPASDSAGPSTDAPGMSVEDAVRLVSEINHDRGWYERMKQLPDDPRTSLADYLSKVVAEQKDKLKSEDDDERTSAAKFLAKSDVILDTLTQDLPETWDQEDFGHQGYESFPSSGYKTYGHSNRVQPAVAFAIVTRGQPGLVEKLSATEDPEERKRLLTVAARHEYKHLTDSYGRSEVPANYTSTYNSLLNPSGWKEVVDSAMEYVADASFPEGDHKDFAFFKSEVRRRERQPNNRVQYQPDDIQRNVDTSPAENGQKESWWSKHKSNLPKWLLSLLAAGGIGAAGIKGHQMTTQDVQQGQSRIHQQLNRDTSPPAAVGRELVPSVTPRQPSYQAPPPAQRPSVAPPAANPYSVDPAEHQRMIHQLEDIENRNPSK